MSRQDEIAAKAVRKSTLKSLEEKKRSRLQDLKENYEQAVREVNIQYAKDPERLKAKYAAADFAKSEKARRKAERKIEEEKKEIELYEKERRHSKSENIGSSIVQGIGTALFIAGTAILDTLGIKDGMDFRSTTIVFYSLFGSSMILMYLCSLLNHALSNFTAKQVFNRLSHILAFLNIGFAYSAYTITKIQGLKGWLLFGIVWVLALVGILFYAISGRRHDRLNSILTIIAGFSGFILLKSLWDVLSTTSFTMLMLAAGFYAVGVVFYNMKKIKYMHLVGNCIMLAGSVYMFFSLFFINA